MDILESDDGEKGITKMKSSTMKREGRSYQEIFCDIRKSFDFKEE